MDIEAPHVMSLTSILHLCQARFTGTIEASKTMDLLYRPLDAARNSHNKAKSGSEQGGQLIGVNTSLEKPYLRLTDFPKKEDVRPLGVLVKSLAHIKSRYIKDEDFEWANEQLKSVRQDLTVQRLRNPFVLEVYETHARILLEEGDLDEFNQCQTVIRNIVKGSGYDDQIGCKDLSSGEIVDSCTPLSQNEETEDEFRGYGILYALVRNAWSQLKLELTQVNALSLERREGIEMSAIHAIQVVKAVQECDYRTFFRLYECAPHLSAYLMDFLVKRVRDQAYNRIIASHRPTVSIEYIRDALHLTDLEETRRFLRQQGASFIHEKGEPTFWIDCKTSLSG